MILRNSFIQFAGSTLTIGDFSVTFTWSSVIEMLIFSLLTYFVIRWIKRTKAWVLLRGAAVLVLLYIIARVLRLNTIVYIFKNIVSSLFLAIVIILQPEIRSALEHLGTTSFLPEILQFSSERNRNSTGLSSNSIDAIVRAMSSLGRNKVGALIVIERTILLNEYIDTGIALDATISTALLEQIFEHNTPLHDGAVIIRGNRIIAATCYLPLSQNSDISKELGTRHRAGLGISEVSDCITLIASEETGALSVAMDGELKRDLTPDAIREILLSARGSMDESHSVFTKFWRGRTKNEK